MESESRVEPGWLARALVQVGVAALALLCLALFDGALAALREPRPPLSVGLLFPVMAFARFPEGAVEALVFVVIAAVLITKARRSRAPELWVLGLSPVVIAISLFCYEILALYEPFRGYPPFVVVVCAFGVALLVSGWVSSAKRFRERENVPTFFHVALLASGFVAYGLNYYLYRGLYPTLHYAVLIASVTLVLSSAVLLSFRFSARARRFAYPVLAWVVAAAVVHFGTFTNAEPYFRYASEMGQLLPGSSDLGFPPLSEAARQAAVARDSDAVERFAAAHHYPVLPSRFRLEDYNVLLIAVEATRFDRTSLSQNGPNTTPYLKLAAQGGFSAERAYSPSSGTLHSMSALFTMKYPASIDITSWAQSWFGEMSAKETTVAELFKAAGYQTFWIGYDHRRVFEDRIVGFKQGFEEVKLVDDEETGPVEGDAAVTRLAIEKLETLAHTNSNPSASARRFFGFVFFSSPHQPYVAHGFPEMPARTAQERYLQEIRNVDVQFGKVMESISALGLQRNTVVIFLSDHGEEFREHGGLFHKTTLYSESIRVPLVILVPGLAGQRQAAPTSTLYLFPWLLLHSSLPELLEPARNSVETTIGPMLRETDGAVVAELSGHDRIKSTLIYPSKKLNYDHQSGLFELFEIEDDPLEQNNIFPTAEHESLLAHFSRYYAIYEATKKYRFIPEKVVPE